MRWFRNGLVGLLTLFACVWLWNSRQSLALKLKGYEGDYQRLAAAEKSIAYVLDRDRWTRFPLEGDLARCLFNASVMGASGKETAYRLDYQFLDGAGEILKEDVYWQIARNDGSEALFYGHGSTQPTNTRQVSWDLTALSSPPRTLALKLGDAPPSIQDVAVRLYASRAQSTQDLATVWRRLSVKERRKLAASNLRPPHQLMDREVEALMLNRMKPVGPMGVDGRDYMARTLYEEEPEPTAPEDRKSYWTVGPQTFFSWISKGDTLLLAAERPVQVVLMEQDGEDSMTERLLDLGPKTVGVKTENNGLLVIKAREDVGLRIRQGGAQPLPSGMRTLAYPVHGEQTPFFALNPQPGEETPLRLDLRLPGEGAARMVCEFLDKDGNPLFDEVIVVDQAMSTYDYRSEDREAVSEPQRVFFRLPARVHGVRLHAETPVLATAFIRPEGLPRLEGENPPPSWFSIKPRHGLQLETVALRLQERPDTTQTLAFGPVSGLLPRGEWLGEHLLLDRSPPDFHDSAQLSAIFTPISSRNHQSVILINNESEMSDSLQPDLMYWGGPGSVRVQVDGKEVLSRHLGMECGLESLGLLPAGARKFHITAPPGMRFAVNYQKPNKGFKRKRLGIQLKKRTIRFAVEKGAEALRLSGRYYWSGKDRAVLDVAITGRRHSHAGPFEHYSFTRKQITLSRDGSSRKARIPGKKGTLVESDPFFMTLFEDLTPGTYQMEVVLKQGSAGWLTVNQAEEVIHP